MVIRKRILVIFVIALFVSCQFPYSNIDEAEDSGYVLHIRNFSETTYIGFTFYNGVIDANNNFVAIDSLVYDNLEISNRNVGDEVTQDGKKYSIIRPFKINKEKLTKFGTWAPPNFEQINKIKPNGRVSLKFLLYENNKSVIKTPNGIGYVFFDILEDGSLR